MQKKIGVLGPVLAFVVLAGSSPAWATPLPYTTGFESPSFTTGTINGQGGWTVYGSTSTVTTAAAHSGSQSLLFVPVAGDGNVVKNSTPLFDASGETPSIYVPAPASNYMATDFWFRTVATTSDTGLYVSTSMGNPASVRNTWLGILDGTQTAGGIAGDLYVEAYAVGASGNFIPSLSPALAWGDWYHAIISEQYVNGANNDLVTYSVYDATNALIWSTTIGSWENYYATCGTCEQAPGPVISDRTGFGGSAGGQGIYIDDFSMTNVAAVPEPGTLALFGAGLGLLGFARRRRKAT